MNTNLKTLISYAIVFAAITILSILTVNQLEASETVKIETFNEKCLMQLGNIYPVDENLTIEYTNYLAEEFKNYIDSNYVVNGTVVIDLCAHYVDHIPENFEHNTVRNVFEDGSQVELTIFVYDEYLHFGDHLGDLNEAMQIFIDFGHAKTVDSLPVVPTPETQQTVIFLPLINS